MNFNNRHTILPVIHVESQDQCLRNVAIAKDSGCDGVFLISHNIHDKKLLEIHHSCYKRWPNWFIGVNCLELGMWVFDKIDLSEVSGVWIDNAGIDETRDDQRLASIIQHARKNWDGIYFGGVAFKYQRKVEDLASAAKIASKYMDVVCTSGPETGQAAHLAKIRTMKTAIGNHPLAIASGIRPDNVEDYLDCADIFLVATGISKSWTELDPDLVKALLGKVRNYIITKA